MGEYYQKLTKVLSSKSMDPQAEKFYDTASFLKRVDQGFSFDLLFLDIYLEEENGYRFAKRLRNENIPAENQQPAF